MRSIVLFMLLLTGMISCTNLNNSYSPAALDCGTDIDLSLPYAVIRDKDGKTLERSNLELEILNGKQGDAKLTSKGCLSIKSDVEVALRAPKLKLAEIIKGKELINHKIQLIPVATEDPLSLTCPAGPLKELRLSDFISGESVTGLKGYSLSFTERTQEIQVDARLNQLAVSNIIATNDSKLDLVLILKNHWKGSHSKKECELIVDKNPPAVYLDYVSPKQFLSPSAINYIDKGSPLRFKSNNTDVSKIEFCLERLESSELSDLEKKLNLSNCKKSFQIEPETSISKFFSSYDGLWIIRFRSHDTAGNISSWVYPQAVLLMDLEKITSIQKSLLDIKSESIPPIQKAAIVLKTQKTFDSLLSQDEKTIVQESLSESYLYLSKALRNYKALKLHNKGKEYHFIQAVSELEFVTLSTDGTIEKWNISNGVNNSANNAADSFAPAFLHNELLYTLKDGFISSYSVSDLSKAPSTFEPLSKCSEQVATAIHVENQYIFTGHDDGIICRWSKKTGEYLNKSTKHQFSIMHIDSSHSRVVASSMDGQISISPLDLSASTIFTDSSSFANRVKSMSDGILTGNSNGTLKMWSLTGVLQKNLEVASDLISSMTFYDDRVFIASHDGSIKEINIEQFKVLSVLPDSPPFVNYISMNKGVIAAADLSDSISFWDVKKPFLKSIPSQNLNASDLIFVSDKRILSSDYMGKLYDLNIDSGIESNSQLHPQGITKIKMFKKPKILTSSFDGTLKSTELSPQISETNNLVGHRGTISTFSVYQETVVSGGWDSTLHVWNLNKSKPSDIIKSHQDKISEVLFSEDGKYLVSIDISNEIRIHTFEDQKLSFKKSVKIPESQITAVLPFDIDTFIAMNKEAIYFISYDGILQSRIESNNEFNGLIKLTIDSRYLLAGTTGQTIQVFDLTTKSMSSEFSGFIHRIAAFDLSPRNDLLAVATDHGRVNLINFNPKFSHQELCDRITPFKALNTLLRDNQCK